METAVRCCWGAVLASVGLWCSGSAVAAERLTPPIANPCVAGDALLAKHRLDDAQLFYEAQHKSYPRLACAGLGLATVAGERVVAERERLNGARAVKEAKRHESDVKAALADAKALEAAARKKKFEQEAELARQRATASYASARASYQLALAHNAQSKAKGDLAKLPSVSKPPTWDEDVGDWVAPFFNAVERVGTRAKKIVLDRADDAGRIVAVFAAGVLLLTLGTSLLLRLSLESKPIRRRLYDLPIVGRLASRPLVVGKIEGKAGDQDIDLTWQLRDALGTSSAPLGQGVDLATGTDDVDQVLDGVSSALDKLPQGQLLAGTWRLLRLVVLSSPLTVDGKVLAKGPHGVGASLTIARGRHVISTITLWQLTYELGPLPADDKKAEPPWDRLAIAGAAWAQYAWLGWLSGRDLRRSLGTDDWQSFAYQQVGCNALLSDAGGDLAQALFARAADRDPANGQALFNLAAVDRRRGEPDQAIERLSRLERTIEPAATRRIVGRRHDFDDEGLGRTEFKRELLWYQATYNLAAAHIQRYLSSYEPGQEPKGRNFRRALRYAQLLVQDIELALLWHDRQADKRVRKWYGLRRPALDVVERRRGPELVAVEGPAIALLAGLMAMRLQGDVKARAQPESERPPDPELSTHPKARVMIIEAVKNEGCSPDLLVEGFLMKDPGRASYRARYNLACYYSRLAALKPAGEQEPLFERALEELALAVETGDLTAFAATDSGLKELRKAKLARFWSVLGGVPPSERLAEIGVVGSSFAAKLIAEGVDSPGLLAQRAGTEGGARELATTIKTAIALVRRWGSLARLISNVDGIGSAEANLLDRARVDSLEALALADAAVLTPVLAAVNEASSTLPAAPSARTVQHWIDGANEALRQAASSAS